MLRATVLGMFACVAFTPSARAVVELNFDSLPATSAYSNGVPVPTADRLSSQFLTTDGISFSSDSP
jgi:hypothetical protein